MSKAVHQQNRQDNQNSKQSQPLNKQKQNNEQQVFYGQNNSSIFKTNTISDVSNNPVPSTDSRIKQQASNKLLQNRQVYLNQKQGQPAIGGGNIGPQGLQQKKGQNLSLEAQRNLQQQSMPNMIKNAHALSINTGPDVNSKLNKQSINPKLNRNQYEAQQQDNIFYGQQQQYQQNQINQNQNLKLQKPHDPYYYNDSNLQSPFSNISVGDIYHPPEKQPFNPYMQRKFSDESHTPIQKNPSYQMPQQQGQQINQKIIPSYLNGSESYGGDKQKVQLQNANSPLSIALFGPNPTQAKIKKLAPKVAIEMSMNNNRQLQPENHHYQQPQQQLQYNSPRLPQQQYQPIQLEHYQQQQLIVHSNQQYNNPPVQNAQSSMHHQKTYSNNSNQSKLNSQMLSQLPQEQPIYLQQPKIMKISKNDQIEEEMGEEETNFLSLIDQYQKMTSKKGGGGGGIGERSPKNNNNNGAPKQHDSQSVKSHGSQRRSQLVEQLLIRWDQLAKVNISQRQVSIHWGFFRPKKKVVKSDKDQQQQSGEKDKNVKQQQQAEQPQQDLSKRRKSMSASQVQQQQPQQYTMDHKIRNLEVESELVKIYEKEVLKGVKPDPDLYIYIEVHGVMRNFSENVKCWTLFKVFDDDYQVIQGKFKLPFYSCEDQTPEMLIEKSIPVNNNMQLAFKVALPGTKSDTDKIFAINEYTIPDIHQMTKRIKDEQQKENEKRMKEQKEIELKRQEKEYREQEKQRRRYEIKANLKQEIERDLYNLATTDNMYIRKRLYRKNQQQSQQGLGGNTIGDLQGGATAAGSNYNMMQGDYMAASATMAQSIVGDRSGGNNTNNNNSLRIPSPRAQSENEKNKKKNNKGKEISQKRIQAKNWPPQITQQEIEDYKKIISKPFLTNTPQQQSKRGEEKKPTNKQNNKGKVSKKQSEIIQDNTENENEMIDDNNDNNDNLLKDVQDDDDNLMIDNNEEDQPKPNNNSQNRKQSVKQKSVKFQQEDEQEIVLDNNDNDNSGLILDDNNNNAGGGDDEMIIDDNNNSSPNTRRNSLNASQIEQNYDGSKQFFIRIIRIGNVDSNAEVASEVILKGPSGIVLSTSNQQCKYNGEEFSGWLESNNAIEINESIPFQVDLAQMISANRDNLDKMYCMFKFVQDSEDGGEQEYGWYAHQLFKDGNLQAGEFNANLYQPPQQVKLPINSAKVKEMNEKLEFEFSYKQI